MNFTQKIKNEIFAINLNEIEKRYLFFSFIFTTYLSSNKEIYFYLSKSEHFNYFYPLLNKYLKDNYFFNSKLKKVILNNDFFENNIKNEIKGYLSNKNYISSFLAGAFIGRGSASNLTSKNYYLELRTKNKFQYQNLINCLDKEGFSFNKILKNSTFCIYFKKPFLIADFLKLLKVSDSLLNFEEARIIRDINTNIKHSETIERYNFTKIKISSDKHLKSIDIVLKNPILKSKLNDNQLKLIALRKKYPLISIEDLRYNFYLKYKLDYSKSTINNWLQKIIKLADNNLK